MSEPIVVVDYDPSWPMGFEVERQQLVTTLGAYIEGGVHHVGSTAVRGLAAKPIIDIMVGVRDLAAARPCIGLLTALDYSYAPYRPALMHWFCKPSPSRRTHHLYLIERGSAEWRARLAFRNFLRTHPETAAAYADLKRRLAETHRNDREGYTDGKSEFVRRVVGMAGAGP